MKLPPNTKSHVATLIAYLYVLLFVYAATSKLIDFENFKVQLGQSPLLSAFAGWVSWCVPTIEVLLALLLMVRRTRLIALIASFALMMMFSTYIYIMLHYSEFVPCSCGGILEDFTWEQHLVFNLFFCLLAVIGAVILLRKTPGGCPFRKPLHIALLFAGISVAMTVLVAGLFISSEQIIHQENNFIRRFPPHLYDKAAELDLKYADYYFAGSDKGIIYLGNFSAPLQIMAVDYKLRIIGHYKVELDDYDLPFRSAKIRISPPYFYLMDGTVPAIFKGRTSDWKAYSIKGITIRFSSAEPVDSMSVLFRGKSRKNGENILGIARLNGATPQISFGDALLERQIDGIFDTDGMLHYDRQLHKLVYLYYYRNEFVVADRNLKLAYRGHTIDTTTRAQVKVETLPNGDRKLAAPPHVTNNYSATMGTQLFVNSGLRGRYESDEQWKKTAVVDVYDLEKNAYKYSLPVYPVNHKKLHAIYATKDHLFFLIDKSIVMYRIIPENRPRQ